MKVIRLARADYTPYVKNINGQRHAIQKSLFDEFGPVRIASPGGRFVGIVRQDPGPAPTERQDHNEDGTLTEEQMQAQNEGMRRMKNSGHVARAPNPKSCKCASWPESEGHERERDDRGRPKQHHKACAFRVMYERQSGGKLVTVAANSTLEAKIHHAGKVTNTAAPKSRLMGKPGKPEKIKEKTTKIPAAEGCPKCRDFTKSKKMLAEEAELGVVLHYQLCEHYKKHKAIALARKNNGMPPVSAAKRVMVFDLDEGAVVREAEPEEIKEARQRLRDEGTAFCFIDEKDYLLMNDDDTALEPAEGEPQVIDTSHEDSQEVSDTEPPPAGSSDDEQPQAED